MPEGVWVGFLDSLDGAPESREDGARIARAAWLRVRKLAEVGMGAR